LLTAAPLNPEAIARCPKEKGAGRIDARHPTTHLLLFFCARSLAATLFCAGVDFGFDRIFEAFDASDLEVPMRLPPFPTHVR